MASRASSCFASDRLQREYRVIHRVVDELREFGDLLADVRTCSHDFL